jgi:hypothetical protein
VDNYLRHLADGVFPGGCFFAATSAELHMRPSAISARLDDFYAWWGAHIDHELRVAQEAGDLAADADLEQLAFEITSHLLHAHLSYMPVGDARVLERSRIAILRLLEFTGSGR